MVPDCGFRLLLPEGEKHFGLTCCGWPRSWPHSRQWDLEKVATERCSICRVPPTSAAKELANATGELTLEWPTTHASGRSGRYGKAPSTFGTAVVAHLRTPCRSRCVRFRICSPVTARVHCTELQDQSGKGESVTVHPAQLGRSFLPSPLRLATSTSTHLAGQFPRRFHLVHVLTCNTNQNHFNAHLLNRTHPLTERSSSTVA